MADYSLQDFWWNKPSRTESQLPALQLGVQIVQRNAQRDLQERDLANDIARTSLMREEMLYKQRLQTSLIAGNAAIAGAIAGVDDWTDMEQVQRVYEVGAQYPMVVGSKAWQGAEYMHKNAVTAQRLQFQAEDRSELAQARLELQGLLNDSRIELNDARILDLQNDIAFGERRMAVQEGNLDLRREEIEQKGKKLSLRNQRMYDSKSKALEREEVAALKNVFDPAEAKRLRMNFSLRRDELIAKFYGASDAPKAPTPAAEAAPQTVAPANKVRVIASDGRPGFIPASQLEEALKAGYKQP